MKKSIPELGTSPFAPVEIVDAANLSAADRAMLQKEEAVISAGRRSFLVVAAALVRIRDYKGGIFYKERYGTFEAYCQERWEFGRAHAYRLIDAAEVAATLSPRGDKAGMPAPTNEKQIRALARLGQPSDMREAWKEANLLADGEEVTSSFVAKVVREKIKGGAKVRTPNRRQSKPSAKILRIAAADLTEIRRYLMAIRKAAKGNARISGAVAEIEKLLPG